ncbi:hypothetical protein HU200_065961 [Digitaria exilis]|uniref:Uncharacterized protein n=1 Tax=Digitaria exilis TaxID=1010633 RepID=A0A835A2Y2_9POAL|nr:hypothetical protein HU200_065961 [Digitaria exilis]
MTKMILQARIQFGICIFREVAILATWCIWKHRNSIIFDGASLSLDRWRQGFMEDVRMLLHRAKPTLKLVLKYWLCNIF